MLGTIKSFFKKIKIVKKVVKTVLIIILILIVGLFFSGSTFLKVTNDGEQINDAKDGVIGGMVTGINRGNSYSATDVQNTGEITAEGRTYYMYYQWSEEYKSTSYGDSTLYEAGCRCI